MNNYWWVKYKQKYGTDNTVLKVGSVSVGNYEPSLLERGKFVANFTITGVIGSFSNEQECKMFLIECLENWMEEANLTYKGAV